MSRQLECTFRNSGIPDVNGYDPASFRRYAEFFLKHTEMLLGNTLSAAYKYSLIKFCLSQFIHERTDLYSGSIRILHVFLTQSSCHGGGRYDYLISADIAAEIEASGQLKIMMDYEYDSLEVRQFRSEIIGLVLRYCPQVREAVREDPAVWLKPLLVNLLPESAGVPSFLCESLHFVWTEVDGQWGDYIDDNCLIQMTIQVLSLGEDYYGLSKLLGLYNVLLKNRPDFKFETKYAKKLIQKCVDILFLEIRQSKLANARTYAGCVLGKVMCRLQDTPELIDWIKRSQLLSRLGKVWQHSVKEIAWRGIMTASQRAQEMLDTQEKSIAVSCQLWQKVIVNEQLSINTISKSTGSSTQTYA